MLIVAAWQAFVEDIARAVLYGTTTKAGNKAAHLAALADASLSDRLERFNTPNMPNVKELFCGVGLQFGAGWTASDGSSTLSSAHASDVIDAWLTCGTASPTAAHSTRTRSS